MWELWDAGGDYETPVQSKNEESYFRRKTLIQASNWLTTVMPIDPGTTLSPETRLQALLALVLSHGSRTSPIAQQVKNPPAMQETLVQILGWEDLLEKR